MQVMFKRGLEANLKKYLYTYTGSDAAQAVEGSFYYAEDSNRLYIGKNVGTTAVPNIKVVPVNQGAIPVNTTANLPVPEAAIPGQFYYVTDSNILAVCSGGHWVQINPDTDTSISSRTDTYSSETWTNTRTSKSEEYFLIADELVDTSGRQFDGLWGLRSDLGMTINVDLRTVTTAGITKTHPIITLTPAVYSITGEYDTDTENTLHIHINDGSVDGTNKPHDSHITLTGENGIHISQTTDGTEGAYTIKGNILNSTGSSITVDEDGTVFAHIKDTDGNDTATSAFFTPIIKFDSSKQESATNTYTFDESNNSHQATITLPIYTKSEVDAKAKEFNSMTYRGVVTADTGVPQRGVAISTWFDGLIHIGDTFKVAGTQFVINTSAINNYSALDAAKYPVDGSQVTLYAGDLLIATGEEQTTHDATGTDYYGCITAASLKWDVIDSGEQGYTNTTYNFYADDDLDNAASGVTKAVGLQFKDTSGPQVGSLGLKGDSYLTVTSESNTDDHHVRLKIEHNLPTNLGAATAGTDLGINEDGITQESNQNISFYIPVFNYDAAGHITEFGYQKYTIKDTHATFEFVTSEGTDSTTEHTGYTTTGTRVSLNAEFDGLEKMQALAFESDNLTITSSAVAATGTAGSAGYVPAHAKVNINLEWDTF